MRGRMGAALVLLSMSLAQSSSGAAVPYAACSAANDPARCLIARAAPDTEDDDSFLEAILYTGSVDLVETYAARLVPAAKAAALQSTEFLKALGITMPPDATAEQLAATCDDIALAAAAQNQDDPFANDVVKRLLGRANNAPVVAQVAVTLWKESDTYSEWSGRNKLTRSRGMPAIWKAIAASPPRNGRLLIDVAGTAEWLGYRDDAFALLRIAAARTDLDTYTRLLTASMLSWYDAALAQRLFDSTPGSNDPEYSGIRLRVAEGRLRQGYDAVSAKVVADDCLQRLGRKPYSPYSSDYELPALAAAGAKGELMFLGETYLAEARKPHESPEDQGDWFAWASEAFRGARDLEKAVAAAREGLPFVEPAINARNSRLKPYASRRAAAVQAAFGNAPVIALYRAGARDEALATGFLTGFDRYKFAVVAGEKPDPIWVLDDKSGFLDGILVRMLIEAGDKAGAERSYRYWRCNKISSEEPDDQFGLLAALSGHRRTAETHFANAAGYIDTNEHGATAATRAWAALNLAADWRRGRTIADRVAASDTTIEERCAN